MNSLAPDATMTGLAPDATMNGLAPDETMTGCHAGLEATMNSLAPSSNPHRALSFLAHIFRLTSVLYNILVSDMARPRCFFFFSHPAREDTEENSFLSTTTTTTTTLLCACACVPYKKNKVEKGQFAHAFLTYFYRRSRHFGSPLSLK